MTNKLDLFALLDCLDRKAFDLRGSMDPEEMKEFDKNLGWILPQWMSGASRDDAHKELLLRFNRNCNIGWFKFYHHPELQAKLLATVGLGKSVRHRFFKTGKRVSHTELETLLYEESPALKPDEVSLWCRLHTRSDLYRLAESFGRQSSEMEKLEQQFTSLGGRNE